MATDAARRFGRAGYAAVEMGRSPTRRVRGGRFARQEADEDQRLGGARPIGAVAPIAPTGFSVAAVAAGFTRPVALALSPGHGLCLLEAGHPQRTPPRVFVIARRSGAASLQAALPAAQGDPAALTALGDGLLVVSAAGAWRIGAGGDVTITALRRTNTGAVGVPLPFGWGAVVDRGALLFCDAGDGEPGTGLIWRLAPAAGAGEAAAAARGPRPAWPPVRRLTGGLLLALALGGALSLFYGWRRRRTWRGRHQERAPHRRQRTPPVRAENTKQSHRPHAVR